jgi:uncharacterized membrane protein
MTIGPLHILVVNLPDEQLTLPISQELRAARQKGVIRLIDMLYATKDMEGNLRSKELSDLSAAEKEEFGVVLQGLFGMRVAYQSEADIDEVSEALSTSQSEDFGFSDTHLQEIAEQVPPGGSAMLAMFEHTWAVGLKEAILNAGGETIVHQFLSPEALELGGTKLTDAVEAAQAIQLAAEVSADEEIAKADRILQDAQTQAAAKIAEAQQILEQAQAEADAKVAQSQDVADAAIAASVREAAAKLREADELMEQSPPEAVE